MSKRKIISIIIILVIIAIVVFVFLSFSKVTNTTSGTTGTNFFSEFFPFGKNSNTNNNNTTNPADVSGYIPTANTEKQTELLTKVSSMPIAGYGIYMKERFKEVIAPEIMDTTLTEETPLPSTPTTKEEKKVEILKPVAPATEFVPSLRYVEKVTGNIYQTFADRIDERKFTTTIIPQVYDAYFGDNGNSVVMRYLKQDGFTIESFAGILPKEILGGDTSISNEIAGSFLPENTIDISISPSSSSMFYLFNSGNNAVGVTSALSGDKKNQIFNSPFTEWLSQWPNERMMTLTTKPSYGFSGFMYSIDPSIKKLNKVLSGIPGLTTLTSPSGKLILYNNNSLSLNIYNTDTETSMSLGVKTMPEKCVWSNDSTMLYCAVPKYITGTNYPDTWYQGEISFSDDFWKINVENGAASNMADPTSFTKGEEIDGIKLSLDEGENYIFFVNKKDSYLWELNLK